MLETIKISTIKEGPNPRIKFEGIDKLAASIKELGLLSPLTVVKSNGTYNLVDGARRFRALKKLKIDQVDVVITELDDNQMKEVPIATDFFKNKLTLGEKIEGICQMINKEKKYSPDGLAKRYGFSKKFINTCLKLGKLDKDVIALIGDGNFDMDDAKELARVQNVDAQKHLAKLLAKSDVGHLWSALCKSYPRIPEDDTFVCGQVKSDPKLGFKYDGYVWCFDIEFGKKAAAAYEERTQKKYAKARDKAIPGKKIKPVTKAEKAKKKQDRVKAKDDLEAQSKLLAQSIAKFIKKKPKKEVYSCILETYIGMLGSHDCKLIARGFGHEFKVSDVNTSDLRKLCQQSITPLVTTPEQTLQFIHCIREIINPAATMDVSMFNINPLKKLIVKLQ